MGGRLGIAGTGHDAKVGAMRHAVKERAMGEFLIELIGWLVGEFFGRFLIGGTGYLLVGLATAGRVRAGEALSFGVGLLFWIAVLVAIVCGLPPVG